jgi:hypothetical protein
MASAFSLCRVLCQPAFLPGFHLTEPLRAPMASGPPFDSGQSSPAQSREKVKGLRSAAGSCPAMWRLKRNTPPDSTATQLFYPPHYLLRYPDHNPLPNGKLQR